LAEGTGTKVPRFRAIGRSQIAHFSRDRFGFACLPSLHSFTKAERKMKIAESIVVGASMAFITISAGIGLVCACMPAFAQLLERVA
jgi:hypothetical protein